MPRSDTRWFDLLREYYGVYLTRDRIDTWMRLIRERDALPDTNEFELCRVLRWVRKQRERDEKARTQKPTLETLIGWVKWYRKDQAIERRGDSDSDKSMEAHIARVKASMRKAENHRDRWDVMCEYAGGLRACQVLDRWAQKRWGDGWRQTTQQVRKEMSESMRALLSGLRHQVTGRQES